MSELYDAPNQQVVRADGSGPWEEGTGGQPGEPAEPEPPTEPVTAAEPTAEELDAMTKEQLLQVAQDRGVDVPSYATKAEIRAALDAA